LVILFQDLLATLRTIEYFLEKFLRKHSKRLLVQSEQSEQQIYKIIVDLLTLTVHF